MSRRLPGSGVEGSTRPAIGGAAKEEEESEGSGSEEDDSDEDEESEEEELEPWRHSIFGCVDHGLAQCCVMFFCDCCIYAKAVSQALYGGSSCCYCLCCACGHLCCLCNRARMRAKYRLEAHNLGAAIGDCMTVSCCCWCARCQQVLEIETREGMLVSLWR